MMSYRAGKLHGEQESFFRDGQQENLVTYTGGLLHGVKGVWDQSGEQLLEAHYDQGSLDGEYFQRMDDDQLVSKKAFDRDGQERSYLADRRASNFCDELSVGGVQLQSKGADVADVEKRLFGGGASEDKCDGKDPNILDVQHGLSSAAQ